MKVTLRQVNDYRYTDIPEIVILEKKGLFEANLLAQMKVKPS